MKTTIKVYNSTFYIAISIFYPPEIYKTILLRIPYTLVEGHKEISIKVSGKLPPYCLAFIIPESGMWTSVEENTTVCLTQDWNWETRYFHWSNNISIVVGISFCLEWKPTSQREISSLLPQF